MPRLRPSALLFTLLLLLTVMAHAQPESQDRLQFGVLRFGMSVDEARAASPEVQWTAVDRHKETGRMYVIRGEGAVTLAGTPFDLELGSRPLGPFSWTLASNAKVRNAGECEERTLAVVAELEGHFGAFHKPADALIGGESRVSVGKSSDAVVGAANGLKAVTREQAMRRDPETFFVRSRHLPASAGDPEVHVGADYEGRARRTCGIEVRITGHVPAPELQAIVASAPALARPSVSYRNRSLRNVGAPSETLHFSVLCSIHAGTGQILACARSEGDVDPHRVLATDWALKYQFRLENAQSDDERQFIVEVPVAMGPADLRTPNVSSGRRLDLAQVKVKRPSVASPLSNLGLKARTEIPLSCEVMEDGSLVCAVKPGITVSTAIAAAAVEVAEGMEVEVTLRDGTSAVGGLVERTVTFMPRE
ncbi:MAG TPA: hypothetical protein VGF69_06675 [Thermoanaerobaculia bacterium]